jgi:hypothetical protein
MRTGGLLRLSLYAMAIFAVAFVNLASVESAVMQASAPVSGVDKSPAAGVEICHAAAASRGTAKLAVDPVQLHKACPYCDVAANPALCGADVAVPTPSTIAWTRYGVQASLGARGPPAFTPNARGPPISTLTI